MSSDSLINAHRPDRFSDIIGQSHVTKSFKKALDDRASHAFIFTGPSGCGKTSIARIGARYVGTTQQNLLDVDAATHSKKDDMRALTASLAFRPLGKNGVKSLIIDEAHAISTEAWQTLLKMTEEPPEWVYWFFLTTEVTKIPATMRTRCTSYVLKPVPVTELHDYLVGIVEDEKFTTPTQVIGLCAKMANGSPRQALSNLAVCYAAKDRAEAAELLEPAEEAAGGLPLLLARALAEGKK